MLIWAGLFSVTGMLIKLHISMNSMNSMNRAMFIFINVYNVQREPKGSIVATLLNISTRK